MKISVICASYLGKYNDNSENRDKKLIRAVNSFLKQTYTNKELIIVSDGCEETNKIYEENWNNNPEVKLFKSPKQSMFSGGVRNCGLKLANGDLVCYLDNDDILTKTHLETIVNQFTDDVDFVYYDDYLALNKEFTKFQTRVVETRYGSIGTSSIAHRNKKEIEWYGFNGYGHDYLFLMKLVSMGLKFKKLEKTPGYVVCHYHNFSA